MIGRVLDPSALDAVVADDIAAVSWLEVARATLTPLYLPALAVSEVRSVRSDRLDEIDDVIDHPSVLFRDLDPADRPQVVDLFAATKAFDATAAHSIVVSRARGWPVITKDAARLRRLDPDVDVLILGD